MTSPPAASVDASEADPAVASEVRWREGIGVVLAFLVTNAIYVGAGAPLIVQRFFNPDWFQSDPPPVEATWYDPEGMEEGEGYEDAPEDAEPGNPNTTVVAERTPMPTEVPTIGEPLPPNEPTTDVPVPEQPAVDLVTPSPPDDAEAMLDPTAEPPEEEEEEARLPTRGQPQGGDAAGDPEAGPVADKPGVDPTKMKDVGDKSGAVNKDTSCSEPHPQITKLGERHWQIDHELIDYYTSSMAVFNTLGYSHRYEEGDVKGWYIAGFGCKGPLYKAGLRSKDVIQLVNGHKTNNLAQIIGLWLTSKRYGDFEIVFWRKGQIITHIYTVPKDEKPGKKPKTTLPDGMETPTKVPPTKVPPTKPPGADAPPSTRPPAEKPPTTKPPTTKPPATKPPAEKPPATKPPATKPPATKPPATKPPATKPGRAGPS